MKESIATLERAIAAASSPAGDLLVADFDFFDRVADLCDEASALDLDAGKRALWQDVAEARDGFHAALGRVLHRMDTETPEERERLREAASEAYRRVFGHEPPEGTP